MKRIRLVCARKGCHTRLLQNRPNGNFWYYCEACAQKLGVSPFEVQPGSTTVTKRKARSRPTIIGDDPRLRLGNKKRERRIPAELMITKLMPNGPPNALYDLGVGCYYEFRTLKIVWPEMEVFGCEPCPEAYQELIPIFTGKLLQIAISHTAGKRKLGLTAAAQGGSSLLHTTDRPTVEVDVWTLDQFDEWAGKPSRILLWMDIEGSELDALKGGLELLKSGRVEWVNAETRDVTGGVIASHPTTQELSNFLDGYGYARVHRYNLQGSYPQAPGDTIYFKKGVRPLK